MRTKTLDCPKCKKHTTWVRQSNQTTAETIVLAPFTMFFSFATREFWWKCTRCGKTIEE